tara:strand:+ start:1083 stop:1775 length:693 start_codon:yes stop_codon:yes gene_type:complete
MNKIVPVLLVLFLTSCAQRVSDLRLKEFASVPNDTVAVAMLGDTMIRQGDVEIGSGLRIKGDINRPHGVLLIGVKSKQREAFLFMKDGEANCYGPFMVEKIDPLYGSMGYDGDGFCVPTNGKKLYLIMANGRPSLPKLEIDNSYEVVPNMERFSDESFIQEFVYNGRTDNQAKFIYREYAESFKRVSFSQEAQYDLDESNIVGFKELKIQIIEATNQKVKYKILQNFGSE